MSFVVCIQFKITNNCLTISSFKREKYLIFTFCVSFSKSKENPPRIEIDLAKAIKQEVIKQIAIQILRFHASLIKTYMYNYRESQYNMMLHANSKGRPIKLWNRKITV